MPTSPVQRGIFAPAFVLFLWLVPMAAPAGATSACSTENCGTCDNANKWDGFRNLLTEDYPDTADTPIGYVDPNDGRRYRLIPTQEGKIWVFDPRTGTFVDPVAEDVGVTPFLDLTSRVYFGGERGLLSMALAPDYATSGDFYLYYTGLDAAPGNNGDVVVERYTRDGSNPLIADPTSAQTILLVAEPSSNHNGGTLLFGLDGMLYVSIGDGGGGCDVHTGADPNGQNLGTLLGALLRIDVRGVDAESTAPECGGAGSTYGVPSLNPLGGAVEGCGEIWAYGLRNPFRMTMDRSTGDLWIADVGQNNWEEIDFLESAYAPLSPSDLRNFGWRCREGCAPSTESPSSCSLGGGECSDHTGTTCQYPTASDLMDPVLCHANQNLYWASIISGYRYRGSAVAGIVGDYLYADVSCGQIWKTTTFDSGNLATATSTCWDSGRGGTYAFAEDALGELYLVQGGGAISCLFDEANAACASGDPIDCCPWADDPWLFGDGFESGDTSEWSLVEPAP